MEHQSIVIIGAGFGGIGLGARLHAAGIDDYLIIERTSDLGGTWSRNTYPGAACDVPSALYCYSFAPNPNWSTKYAQQEEILEYLRTVSDDYDVTRHMRFDTEVTGAAFDEEQNLWRISTDKGDLTASFLVTAVGAFTDAATPAIPGLESFSGTAFHTLHWNHDHDLAGRRVAVIGTGATAVQVIPQIAPIAQSTTVFQRTPPWIVPRMDHRTGPVARRLFRSLPITQRAVRAGWYTAIESFGLPGFVNTVFRHPFEALGRLQLARQVADPELRRTLTPDYMIGCKRAIFSDTYYPALCRADVEVVTDAIESIGERSVRTADGREHEVDTIILATGFTATPRVNDGIKGLDGRSLNDVYQERPQSYLGVTAVGFPNLFTVLGRFGAAGNQSAIFMVEGQFDYIVDAVGVLRSSRIRRFDVRPEVQQEFVTEMHARSHNGTWLNGGCSSYYTDAKGENSGLYPGWSFDYRRRTKQFDPAAYELSR